MEPFILEINLPATNYVFGTLRTFDVQTCFGMQICSCGSNWDWQFDFDVVDV